MNERLFQLVWSRQLFETTNLTTVCGVPVQILDYGELNTGDGADFRNASIRADNLTLFGDIELHLYTDGWYAHHHHRDIRYNNVILHVVLFEKGARPVTLFDGSEADSLVLNERIHPQFREILSRSAGNKKIPCHGYLDRVSDQIIRRQLDESAKAYFNKKISDLTQFYDASQPPSVAWVRMLGRALFDGLGISRNRSQMVRLFDSIVFSGIETMPLDHALYLAYKQAGLEKSETPAPISAFEWNMSAARPGNQPHRRIRQALIVWKRVIDTPFSDFIHEEADVLWKQITAATRIGKERGTILFYTVFLPALYLLGTLFHAQRRQAAVYDRWLQTKFQLPDALSLPLTEAGISKKLIKSHPGAAYQLKSVCREYRCSTCHIMKAMIQT